MSAEMSGDVSRIQDEDVLRRMWQDTEDFGKKKEIRSHMYKLREERLRNFYSSSDSTISEIQRAQSTPGLHEKVLKEGNGPTHADSLADHSFLSLKSKEIRDSGSPTRDYRISEKMRGDNQGWQVTTTNESSPDGKTHTTSKIATTSGSDKIQGGVANYAAKCEQNASVYNDGDDKNFTKSVAANSKSVLQQEAKGGDENSSFQSFSTSTSSSSKKVTEHRSETGEIIPTNANDNVVIRKTYTTDVPAQFKNNPNYIDGNTKVTTETRTLPDGSKVTTTRYETKSGNNTATSSSTNYETSSKNVTEQKSSSNRIESRNSTKMIQDHRDSTYDIDENISNVRRIPHSFDQDVNNKPTTSNTINITKNHKDVNVETNRQTHIINENINQSHKNVDQTDDVRLIRVIQEKEYIPREHPTSTTTVRQEIITTKDDKFKTTENIRTNEDNIRATITKQVPQDWEPEQRQPTNTCVREQITTVIVPQYDQPEPKQPNNTTSVHEHVTTQHATIDKKTTTQDDVHIKITQENQHNEPRTPTNRQPISTYHEIPFNKQNEPGDRQQPTPTQQPHYVPPENIEFLRSPEDRTPIGNRTPAVSTPGDRTPAVGTPGDRTPIGRAPETTTSAIHEIITRIVPQQCGPDQFAPKPQEPEDFYIQQTTTATRIDNKTTDRKITTDEFTNQIKDTRVQTGNQSPRKHEPIAPNKSAPDQKPSQTDYQTTYRTDYVSKRISVDLSPTHDAFARSLRAKSPDRDKKQGSVRSLKSSTSSLRRSTSPDKDKRQPERKPDSRGSSPIKRTNTETTTTTRSDTTSSRVVSSPRHSPTKQTPATNTIGRCSPDRKPVKPTTNNYDTITKTKRISGDDTHKTVVTKTKTTDKESTIDSSTLTRPRKNRPRSRSTSPTTPASDIEFVKSTEIITDLDDETTTVTRKTTTDTRRDVKTTRHTEEKRPTTLNVTTITTSTTKQPKRITDRSPSSPLSAFPSSNQKTPVKEKPQDKLKRRDTYEERCRHILGINDKTTEERTEIRKTTKEIPRSTPRKSSTDGFPKSPDKNRSPSKDFPSQRPRSSITEPTDKRRPSKEQPNYEVPSHTRKSPEKPRPNVYQIQEFPSQIRRSPEKPIQKTYRPKDENSPDTTDKVPILANEPLCTKTIVTHLGEDEDEQISVRTEKVTKYLPSETGPEKPHKTVKKDSPEKPKYSSPDYEQTTVDKTFIDTERFDTDITITGYEKEPDYKTYPERESPGRTPSETIDITRRTTTSDTTEYTEYGTPNKNRPASFTPREPSKVGGKPGDQRPLQPDNKSPKGTPGTIKETTYRTGVSEYTEESITSHKDGTKPLKPRPGTYPTDSKPQKCYPGSTDKVPEDGRKPIKPTHKSPAINVEKTTRTTTEYTDEYGSPNRDGYKPEQPGRRPLQPGQKSPDGTTRDSVEETTYRRNTTSASTEYIEDYGIRDTNKHTPVQPGRRPLQPGGKSPDRSPIDDTKETYRRTTTQYNIEDRETLGRDECKPGQPGQRSPDGSPRDNIEATTYRTTTSTTGTTKYTEDYGSPDKSGRIPVQPGRRPLQPGQKSPGDSPRDTTKETTYRTTKITDKTQYTEDYESPDGDRRKPGQPGGRPLQPGKKSPYDSPRDSTEETSYRTTTKMTGKTQYTEDYETPDRDGRKPGQPSRRPLQPGQKSPRDSTEETSYHTTKITGQTQYTKDYDSPDRDGRKPGQPGQRPLQPGQKSPDDAPSTDTVEETTYCTTTTDNIEYTDDNDYPDRDRNKSLQPSRRPEQKSPDRSLTDTTEESTYRKTTTDKTQYREDRQQPDRRPSQPIQKSPDRPHQEIIKGTTRHTTVTDRTEYTDEYVTPQQTGSKPGKPRKDYPRETAEAGVTEYTDEYRSPKDGHKPSKPNYKTPSRVSSQQFEETRHTMRTNTTDYSEEYSTPKKNRGKPLQPKSPENRGRPIKKTPTSELPKSKGDDEESTDSEVHETIEIDEETNTIDYITECYENNKPTRSIRKPDRESPENTHTTKLTDEYFITEKQQRTAVDRLAESTTKSTQPTPQSRKPSDTKTPIKNIPKQVTPSKPHSKTDKKTEPQQPKCTTTTITRIIKAPTATIKAEKITYEVDVVSDEKIEDTTQIRTHRVDDFSTSKVTKTCVDVKSKTPKYIEPKPKPKTITTYQNIPDHRKPATDRYGKPITEQKITRRPEPARNTFSPRDKPTSPERRSPFRQEITDEKTYMTNTVTQRKTPTTKYVTETYVVSPKTKTPTKPTQKQPELQSTNRRHVVTTTIQVRPKTKPQAPKQTVQKTTDNTTKRLSQPKTIPDRSKPKIPVQNGRGPTIDYDSETEYYDAVDEVTNTKRVSEETYRSTQRNDSKVTRTTSDQINKIPHRVTPTRGQSKPEILTQSKQPRPIDSGAPKKSDKKVITTKTITINNSFDDEKEIVVNLQRSQSSREQTPDRSYPRPVSEDEDLGIPRYPDDINEPDEPSIRRRPTKLTDVPIIESEDVYEHTNINEYEDTSHTTSRRVDKVEETDECLLTVNQKRRKFVDEADKQVTQKQQRPVSPKPNVTDYTTKTNQYITVQRVPERPKSPKCKNYPDDQIDDTTFTSVTDKVSHFIETAEHIKTSQKPRDGPTTTRRRPDAIDVTDDLKSDDCLLSVSDKVTKFSTQRLDHPNYKKPVSLSKIDVMPMLASRQSPTKETHLRESPKRESPLQTTPRRDSPPQITTECVQIESDEQMYTRRVSPNRYSPTRRTSGPNKTPYTEETPPKQPRNKESFLGKKFIEPDGTPKSSRDDEKRVSSPFGRPRSTDSIRRAKELFENIAKEQVVHKYRPTVFDKNRPKQPDQKCTDVRTTKEEDVKLTDIGVYNVKTKDVKNTKYRYPSDEDGGRDKLTTTRTHSSYNKDDLKSTRLIMDRLNRPRSPSKNEDTPGYLRPLDRSERPHSPYDRSRSPRPDSQSPTRERSPRPHDPSLDEIPHYMWPLDRTVHDHGSVEHSRPHSRSRESSPDTHDRVRSGASSPDQNIPGYMKPLDRHVSPKSPHRKSVTELEQIVSKRHSVDKSTKFTTSETGKITVVKRQRKLTSAEIETLLTTDEIQYVYELEILEFLLEKAVTYEQRRRVRTQIRIVKQLIEENKLSIVVSQKNVKPKGQTPETNGTQVGRKTSHSDHHDGIERKTEYTRSYDYNERRTSSEFRTQIRNSSPETKVVREKSPRKSVEKIVRQSPERRVEECKRVVKTEFKPMLVPVRKTPVDEKPSWVTQRPLKKTTDIESKTRKTSSTVKKSTRISPAKDGQSTDVITSSYGVGPTDANGSPLFGLRALRTQNKTDTTKVQGTVIRSHYYSENGQEPTGQITVTKYSTDPNDFNDDGEERNGLVSVTTTQKFGSKGTPSYRAITDQKNVTDFDDEECETVTRKSTTKVSRRGSVKEMSKKFIDNAVETSKIEKQSSYPKAGLILRTSSFKDTANTGTGNSRESSPETHESVNRTVTVRNTSSSTTTGEKADTFLNNKTRVRGVQDVITRMKNADDDVQEGDTPEDQEARSLLNKFIGSQVILSGMEQRSTSSSSPSSTNVKRTTTTTSTTTKGGGKPTVVTRTFTHPITEEDLATVWDEQTLKLLLERSTEYEERQIIRARLRDVMAEQEVCADFAAKSKEESGNRIEENGSCKTTITTEGPITTSEVVTTTRVSSQQTTKKPLSPFAKFRQLDKQNSLNTPPGRTPRTPTGSGPLFKFTDPELNRQASTVKERLLQWCQMKTKEYENIQLDNFSSSWADGLAFCALIHHFLPDAFDYHALTPKERRHNFTLAFRVADEKADIVPLLDVDDMVATRRPDWKCVFTYVQTIYSRFKNED